MTLVVAVFFIFILLLIFASVMPAQDPVVKVVDWMKEVDIAVGAPIVNANTAKALKAVDRVPGLKQMLRMYNVRYGNDSVQATHFVDREPDEKNTSDPLVHDYYDVVFVADSVHQVTRWWTFLVRKDYQEVLYYDLKLGKTSDINDWKKSWPANKFLKESAGLK